MSEWISVRDRLPESTGEYVLVLASGKPSENVTLVQAYIRGRIKFVGAKNGAPFPCAIVVFGEINEEIRR